MRDPLGGADGDERDGRRADDEYWVISAQNGMRYYFGWGRAERSGDPTHSVLTVPVAGDDTGEPCHSQFPEPCTQGWCWNLDRVVDPNEVENAYFYDKQTNYCRSVINTDKARQYDAASHLTKIEYGWASQIAGAKLPAKVELSHVGRCVERMSDADPLGKEPAACPGISANPDSYPDVPTDLMCDGTSADNYCAGKTYHPTFFSTDMLWDIKTYVSDDGGATWDPAMRYQMKYGLPNPDGTIGKTLWLDYVQREGYGDGPDQRLPVINFNGEWLDNQVGSSTLNFRRVDKIYGDLGSVTSVTYGQPDACDINNLPSESSNTQDCFWRKWTPGGSTAPETGWFKKYLVTQVSVDPGVGRGADIDGDPVMTTRYEYHGGAGWRFPNDPLIADADETWSEWRGAGRRGRQLALRGGGPSGLRTSNVAGRSQFLSFHPETGGQYDDEPPHSFHDGPRESAGKGQCGGHACAGLSAGPGRRRRPVLPAPLSGPRECRPPTGRGRTTRTRSRRLRCGCKTG
ncbi:hypothetical protein [Streptomyces sp. NPDC001135]